MHKSVCFLFAALSVLFSGCLGTRSESQQVTATAYAEASMQEAMEAAEESALVLCALDFESGADAYIEKVCALSTDLACLRFETEIQSNWSDLQQAYGVQKLACAPSSSRLVEEGRQYGRNVQFWRVNLVGTQGFTDDNAHQTYWVQVAEQNGEWKFNRLIGQNEIALYVSMSEME